MDATTSGVGGPNISELHQLARRMLAQTREGLSRLEWLESSLQSSAAAPGVGLASSDLAPALRRDLAQILRIVAQIDAAITTAFARNDGQRNLWKRKLETVVEEANSLKASLDRLLLHQERQMQEVKERTELLQRRNGDSAHIISVFDEEAQAIKSAHNSNMMLEDAYATGVAVLSKYAEQRERLKKAQRKAFDILNTLGLSNSVLKLVERRHRVDKWIAYAGMMITVIVVYAFWRWTR